MPCSYLFQCHSCLYVEALTFQHAQGLYYSLRLRLSIHLTQHLMRHMPLPLGVTFNVLAGLAKKRAVIEALQHFCLAVQLCTNYTLYSSSFTRLPSQPHAHVGPAGLPPLLSRGHGADRLAVGLQGHQGLTYVKAQAARTVQVQCR